MKSFTLIEKLATLKTLDSVILADGKIDPGEEKLLKNVLLDMDMEPFEVELAKVESDCALFEEKNDGGISIHVKHDGPVITSIVIHSDSKMLDVEYLD